MDKKLPLALLLLACALPAAAEFCTLNEHSGRINVMKLKKPRCSMDNDLRVTERANDNRYGPDLPLENPITLTDSWPGFMDGDKKCRKALSTAESLVFSGETYIYGTTMLGWKIFAWRGECDSLTRQFQSKREALIAKGKKPSYEDVLEAMGAFEVSKGDLGERLVEGKVLKKD